MIAASETRSPQRRQARGRSAAGSEPKACRPRRRAWRSPAAQGDDAGGILEREATGDVGGGDLALGVADDRRRLDPELPPEPRRARPSRRRGRAGRRRCARASSPSRVAQHSRRDHSTKGASACSQASIRRRRTGEASISSSAIRGHWEPWPGKTKTGRCVGAARRRGEARGAPRHASAHRGRSSSSSRRRPSDHAPAARSERGWW